MQILQVIYALVIVIGLSLFGWLEISVGLRSLKLANDIEQADTIEKGAVSFYRSYSAIWRNRLLLWHVVEHGDEVSTVLKDVLASWGLIQAPQKIASGITSFIYIAGYLLLMLLNNGMIIDKPAPLFMLLFVCITGNSLGEGIGIAIGFWRTKQEFRRRVTYADLRQRSLADYRSPLFRWLLGLVMLLNVVLLFILPPLFGLRPSHDPWLGVICASVIYLSGECFLSYIITLPRLIVTSNLTIAQHADDMLRALVISDIHERMVERISIILAFQWYLFYQSFFPSPSLIAFQIFFVSILLLLLPTSIWRRASQKGRLGGKITGWPWSKMVAE